MQSHVSDIAFNLWWEKNAQSWLSALSSMLLWDLHWKDTVALPIVEDHVSLDLQGFYSVPSCETCF